MRNRYLFASAAILVLIISPYLIAQTLTGSGTIFGGFLFNPLDGNTYLAKMQEGWQGAWRFQLPYSAQPNPGAYLFLFYLFLGHLSRWLSLSPILVFHLARVLSAGLLLAAMKVFFTNIFKDRPKVAFWAFLFAGMGSGLGWLVALEGGFTSDFWVAEAYPFLAMYSSPHFSLALAIMLWFLARDGRPFQRKHIPWLALAGLALGIVLPFAVVVTIVVVFGVSLYDFLTKKTIQWQTPLVFLFTGGLAILYQFIVIRTDPILVIWDAQNQTPSPAIWDFLISFMPLLVLAIWGIVQSFRSRNRPVILLSGWLILGLLLIYLPFNLQRRFMLGYMIPVAGLAAFGLAELKTRRKKWIGIAAIGLTLPTLGIILLGGVLSVKNGEPSMLIRVAEMDVYRYLAQNSQADDIVLASPESGLFIPAYTGRRVIYGHPFETVNAPAEKTAVEGFFENSMNAGDLAWARARGVKWILWGPREDAYGVLPVNLPAGMVLVYQEDGVKLFELQAGP
ncbi:hypothetical protein LARV_02513 [Longilinea arvoryzae]|uniref:Glycosyltransferase RgtA/B/C/D-like domain-containing protein n=1 Tax=Longilinea arvoryzae TaxID=360412 RepID=A0A0S7BKI2_9CHLR|nr:hypothetical protein [Longilinea arvoryzae]GAP14738.1 hypothetical protein LARV_02513 [Longilinea arvoryzae]